MHIFKTNDKVIVKYAGLLYSSPDWTWDNFINRQALHGEVLKDLQSISANPLLAHDLEQLCTPIAGQEIWASGVTYLRSKDARMEESKDAGGGDFYARVYNAERPEIFFKSSASRAVGPGGTVRIRKDSEWNVPEPELVLFICSAGTIEGYMIGDDMSSRDIEGENPLYLPQAKTYDACAAVGPCVYLTQQSLDKTTNISLKINRNGSAVYDGKIAISQMKRTPEELVSFVFRECSFPHGCLIMTGTGIVPGHGFSLKSGDEIKISIDQIGTLVNQVM